MYNGYTLANGKQVAIDKVEIENLAEFETTYNFEVADFHTYYVSESNVLVHNKCPTVEYNGEERVLYRGGDTFEATPNQVKMDAKGNVLPKRGLSVNVDPANSNVIKYGGPHKITYMPQELTFIPIGSPGHYEIIPKVAMPFTQYQNLLNQIIVITV